MEQESTFIAPALCRHKSKNRDRAYFRFGGKFYWCGPWGTAKAAATYARFVAELEAFGGMALQPQAEITVCEMLAAYWEHAKIHYRKPDGTPTKTLDEIRRSVKIVNDLYGDTPVRDFGPRALKVCRAKLVATGAARNTVNARTAWIKNVFAWAVENEMAPGEVRYALECVKPLERGRTTAPEGEPVRPVADAHVEAVRPFVSAEVWAMIRLQLLTGARPGEIIGLKATDLDRSIAEVWTATITDHKNAHHGHTRTIYLNAEAQEILRPFMLKRPLGAPLFSPREAERERHAMAECHRRPDQKPNPKKTPRTVRDSYNVTSYRTAIVRACDAAGVPRWSPNQLRHTAGTKARAHGLDVAQVFLGHRNAKTTEIYAELDKARALAFVVQHQG